MTSLFGIVVVDCWRAYRHHLHSKHFDKDIPARDFADLLYLELLTNKEGLKDNQDVSLPPLHDPANMDDAPALPYPLSIALGDDASSDRSRKSCRQCGGLSKSPNSACSSVTLDPAVQQHHKEKFPEVSRSDESSGTRRAGRTRCRICYMKGFEHLSRF